MSVLGFVYYGYFYAFHLLGIVNLNPLLKGVIRAITYNGKIHRFMQQTIVNSTRCNQFKTSDCAFLCLRESGKSGVTS